MTARRRSLLYLEKLGSSRMLSIIALCMSACLPRAIMLW